MRIYNFRPATRIFLKLMIKGKLKLRLNMMSLVDRLSRRMSRTGIRRGMYLALRDIRQMRVLD